MTGLLAFTPVTFVVVVIYFLILNWKIDNIKDDIEEIKRKMEGEE